MSKTLVEQYLEDPNQRRLFQQEKAIYEVTGLIESVMEEEGVSRAELARKLGKSKGWVTQLLDGEANKTIRTIADVFAVLGREFQTLATPTEIVGKQTYHSQLSSGNLTWADDYKPQITFTLRSVS